MNPNISNALKGLAMGIAEIIPGVSGGTIAFITGIYERLIKVITKFDFSLIGDLRKNGIKSVWEKIDGNFLLSLLIGMATGIVIGALVITNLLDTHPEPLWGFFFGLIIASSILVYKEIKKHNWKTIVGLIAGTLFAYMITIISPAEGSESYIYVFISGMLAICALILPGISGSFILLLMGMYSIIIPTLKRVLSDFNTTDLSIMAVFALGCLLGITLFSKVLTYLFESARDIVLSVLTGFMLGSLNKIWPWRNVTTISNKETGEVSSISDYSSFSEIPKDTYKIMTESQVMPSGYEMGDPKFVLTVLALISGFILVRILAKYSSSSSTF